MSVFIRRRVKEVSTLRATDCQGKLDRRFSADERGERLTSDVGSSILSQNDPDDGVMVQGHLQVPAA